MSNPQAQPQADNKPQPAFVFRYVYSYEDDKGLHIDSIESLVKGNVLDARFFADTESWIVKESGRNHVTVISVTQLQTVALGVFG